MLRNTLLLDELLSRDVASSKKNRSRHALGEQRASGKLAAVPVQGVRKAGSSIVKS